MSSALAVGGSAPAAATRIAPPASTPLANLTAQAQPVFDALLNLTSGSGGPVRFTVAPQTQAPILTSAPGFPPSSKPQYVLPSSPDLVGRISATVLQFAASAIYPAPVFSFAA